MKLAHTFVVAIMMMAMPAFADEVREVRISSEISLQILGMGNNANTPSIVAIGYKKEDGLKRAISFPDGVVAETSIPPKFIVWLEAKEKPSTRYMRTETRLNLKWAAEGVISARLETIRVPKQKKGTMSPQAEMPVRTEKEVVLNKMVGHFLVSVLARLDEAIRSGKLETAPESPDMLVLKRDIQALMAQPLETVYRTPRKKKLASNSSE